MTALLYFIALSSCPYCALSLEQTGLSAAFDNTKFCPGCGYAVRLSLRPDASGRAVMTVQTKEASRAV